ncbi:MAG: hypothetical protein GY716_04845 [bacterium]|nr:hypothetical protein [bacterium]
MNTIRWSLTIQLVTAVLVCGTVSAQICGDCNNNLTVDAHDVATLQAATAGTIVLGEPERSACDLDQSQSLDSVDLLLLGQHLEGSLPTLTCAQSCGDCTLDGVVDSADLNLPFGPSPLIPATAVNACNSNADDGLATEDLLSLWQLTSGARSTLGCALEMVCGDCDGDGDVDGADSQLAADHATELAQVVGRPYGSCDVTLDGTINAVDALQIQQFVTNGQPTLRCALRSVHDSDQDGVFDDQDNCPASPNADQVDADGDSRGAACDCDDSTPSATADADQDQDGVVDCFDNCVRRFNPDQEDADADGIGDDCDCEPDVFNATPSMDTDFDGFPDCIDTCPFVTDPRFPDAGDLDADVDAVPARCDCDDADPSIGRGPCLHSAPTAGWFCVDGAPTGQPWSFDVEDLVNNVTLSGASPGVPPSPTPSHPLLAARTLAIEWANRINLASQAHPQNPFTADPTPLFFLPCFTIQPNLTGGTADLFIDIPTGGRCHATPGLACQFNPDLILVPLDDDLDGDGLEDGIELLGGLDPDDPDTDGDGVDDGEDDCPDDPENDADGDQKCARFDNCPRRSNPDQADADADGIGDVCDCAPGTPDPSLPADTDLDGIPDCIDTCPFVTDPIVPDAGDVDADGDGVPARCDCNDIDPGFDFGPCLHSPPTVGYFCVDGDATGQSWSFDVQDGDGGITISGSSPGVAPSSAPLHPLIAARPLAIEWANRINLASQADAQNPFTADPTPLHFLPCFTIRPNFTPDDSIDLLIDLPEGGQCQPTPGSACPFNPDLVLIDFTLDDDADGLPDDLETIVDTDPTDPDTDDDGVADGDDGCPTDPGNDEDGDQKCARFDNCPRKFNPDQADADADGIGDVCDCEPGVPDESNPIDTDLDGTPDCIDSCPFVTDPPVPGAGDVDADGDGVPARCDCDDGDDSTGLDVCEPVEPTAAWLCVSGSPTGQSWSFDVQDVVNEVTVSGGSPGVSPSAAPLHPLQDARSLAIEFANRINLASQAHPQNPFTADPTPLSSSPCFTLRSNMADGGADLFIDASGGGQCLMAPESSCSFNPELVFVPLLGDDDSDGLDDGLEEWIGTDPGDPDSDDDGVNDGDDDCPDDPANDADGDQRCASFDNCPTDANADQSDGDADGAGDACDCGPSDPSISLPTSEVGDVQIGGNSGTLSWQGDAQAEVYHVYRGSAGTGVPFDFEDLTCADPAGTTDTTFQDAVPAAPGELLFYLVTGSNACGESSLGTGPDGDARPNPGPCQ